MSELETQFDDAMHNIYQRAKTEAKYNATIFPRMLEILPDPMDAMRTFR